MGRSDHIFDERTGEASFAPQFDKPREDVSLLVLKGPDVGQRYLVPSIGGIIGRNPEAAVNVRDPNVSRQHAAVEFTSDGRVVLTDLGSRHGVFVNGVRISRAELYDGNYVELSADTVVRVRFQDPAETELLDELEGFVVRDRLTGLPNRRYLTERLPQELSFARRHKVPLAVAMLDLDDLAKVNDTDGRRGGDMLVKAVADLVRKKTRLEDVVVRYGGDELVVVQRAQGSDECEKVCERLRKLVRKQAFDVGDVAVRATVSFGVASYEPGKFEIHDFTQLIDRADSALYRAKHGGKDRVGRWR
jgi:diguanylate cyclase (GGDEF)-like protein